MKRQISSYKGRKLCLWQKLLLSAVLAGAVTFAGLFGAVLYGSYDHIQGDPRAMVVLGCQVMPDGEPSILLRDRLDRALDYLEDHPDLMVVVSGGQGDNEPVTEARCMADYLMERGVEEDQLLLEERSHNTDQNLRYSRELLEAEGYVSSVPGKGSFAAPHSQVDSARRDGLLRTFDETATELFFLGLSADALSQRLSKLDGGVRQ